MSHSKIISDDKFLKANIIIVDDDLLSIRLIENILRKNGFTSLTITQDPREARRLYREIKPELVILDLNMPHLTGFDVLNQLREIEEKDSYLPVIVITADESQDTRFKALDSGAKDFLQKPFDNLEVIIRIRNLIEVRMLQNEIREQNKNLEERVLERTKELYLTQLDVIFRLARAVEFRDSDTGMHTVRMSNYSACLAKRAGLNDEECEMILTASTLHDIGKIAIPDRILIKNAKLTEEEWMIMKSHTTVGAELLSRSNSKFLIMAREIALTHHERWDGTGYPQGLKAENIPLIGRICGLCDVYDALTSPRPYKKAWSIEDTLTEIKRLKGTHFDPQLVEYFLEIIPEIKRIGERNQDTEEQSIG